MLLIREEYTNVTEGYRFGDSGEPTETWTDDIGKLFCELRREYGRASKVYIDTQSGTVHHIGWTFTKRMKYEDARDDSERSYYVREIWVTLYEPCEVDDRRACISKEPNGAVTRHPFARLDIDEYRRRNRKAA
jgi:hypothetical protein